MTEKKKLQFTFNAPVVLSFVGICFIAMLLNIITHGASNRVLFSVYRAPLTNPLTWFRMVGHIFGHADWNHLLGNMMLILLLGPMLEEKYGAADLIAVILCTALLTGLIYYFFFPSTMLLGASGVVFAMILLSSITGAGSGGVPVTFLLVAVMYIGREVWQSVTSDDNVAYLGHIIGGAVGSGLGFLIKRERR